MTKREIDKILKFFSPTIRQRLAELNTCTWNNAHEIRLTKGKQLMVMFNNNHIKLPVICDEKVMNETLLLLTDNSIYSVNDKLTNGFLTVEGGHRVGICGTAVINDNVISAIRNVSSINLRIKREMIGIAEKLMPYIVGADRTINNTLIISPPKCGKTTLLRDIARVLGKEFVVSIVDERSEIAGVYAGIPQNDIGELSTVLDGCVKSIGIPIVIRSMAPEVIITDELGNKDDADAIAYAVRSGVKIIASAHGDSHEALKEKYMFRNFLNEFKLIITLANKKCVGEISNIIYNGESYG